MLTNEEYAAKFGTCCPVCEKNDAIDGNSSSFDGGGATLELTCQVCGSKWEAYYILAGFNLDYAGVVDAKGH